MSSIASSAWSGGVSSETVDDITTETMHKGLDGALGMSNGFGTIAFGTISGGAGAALTGGNFWQSAVTGLFVSGLNHTMHEDGDPNGTGLSTRRYHTDKNGDIDSESLNYFPRGDKTLFNRAESEPLGMGELTIYGHGNSKGFANIHNFNQNFGLSNTLKSDSIMRRNFANGQTKSLTMVLKSCNTGSLQFQNNISHVLIRQKPGLTIYSASHN